MALPMIDLVIATWPNHPKRWWYFQLYANRMYEMLYASRHEVRWQVSSESERDPKCGWYGDALAYWCSIRNIPLVYRDGPASLGAGMNAAADLITSDYGMILQDDWNLMCKIDLSDGIDFMEHHPKVDILRYSWPGLDRVTVAGDIDGMLILDPQGNWPYGDDPHIRRATFFDRFGRYIEGGVHGDSENGMIGSFCRNNAFVCATPTIYFGHGGTVPAVINDIRERTPAGKR